MVCVGGLRYYITYYKSFYHDQRQRRHPPVMNSFSKPSIGIDGFKKVVHGKDEIFYGPAKHWFKIRILRPRNEPLRQVLRPHHFVE